MISANKVKRGKAKMIWDGRDVLPDAFVDAGALPTLHDRHGRGSVGQKLALRNASR